MTPARHTASRQLDPLVPGPHFGTTVKRRRRSSIDRGGATAADREARVVTAGSEAAVAAADLPLGAESAAGCVAVGDAAAVDAAAALGDGVTTAAALLRFLGGAAGAPTAGAAEWREDAESTLPAPVAVVVVAAASAVHAAGDAAVTVAGAPCVAVVAVLLVTAAVGSAGGEVALVVAAAPVAAVLLAGRPRGLGAGCEDCCEPRQVWRCVTRSPYHLSQPEHSAPPRR